MSDPRTLIAADDLNLRGYVGPAEFLQYRTWYRGVLLSPTHGYISRPGHGDDIAGYSPSNIRFDTALSAVRDHIARTMAAAGFPIEHLLDRPGSPLTAEQSAVLVGWSWTSWRRGGPTITAILPAWSVSATKTTAYEVGCRGDQLRDPVFCICGTERWVVYIDGRCKGGGPETGEAGRAAADKAALAANIALLNPDGSVVTPEIS